jgi:hypothetical protein
MGASSVTGTGPGAVDGPYRGDVNQVTKIFRNSKDLPGFKEVTDLRDRSRGIRANTEGLAGAGDPGFLDPPVWNDLRIPVTSTIAQGSNPPIFGQFQNDGNSPEVGEYAYRFHLNQYGTLPDAGGDLNFNQADFTVGFWTVPDTDGTGIDNKIVYKAGGISIGLLRVSNPKLRINLPGAGSFDTNLELSVGARNCVVVTVDDNNPANDTTVTVYINNAVAGSRTYSGYRVSDATATWYIAADSPAGSSRYEGIIDELRIWDKTLTEIERESYWNNGLGTTNAVADSNTVVGYHFNEGSGTTVDNFKGDASHDITLSADTDWVGGLVQNTLSAPGVFTYIFPPDVRSELFFTAQMDHGYKMGTDMNPHVHYSPTTSNTGNVVWGIEYTVSPVNGIFGTTNILEVVDPVDGIAYKHQPASFGIMDGIEAVSFMFVGRVYRDGTSAEDTYPDGAALLEIDIHYLADSIGSSLEFTKPL